MNALNFQTRFIIIDTFDMSQESVYLDLPSLEQRGAVQVPQEVGEEPPLEEWRPSPVEKKRSPAVFETLERALAQAQAAASRPSSVSSPPPATCKYK